MIFMSLEIFAGVTGTQDGVAHFAHLGGAAVGFILLMIDTGRIPMFKWWGDFKKIYEKPYRFAPWQSTRYTEVSDTKFYDVGSNKEIDPNQKIIDEILDKISREGYQNLSDEEKKILFEASKKII